MADEKLDVAGVAAASAGRSNYRMGSLLLRGKMVPGQTSSGRLASAEEDDDWTDDDPWRVLRILSEFVDGFDALAKLGPAITVFGSARIKEGDPVYDAARTLGRRLVEEGYAVITGGGPGIMEAANRGADEADGTSVGLGVELPFEEDLNDWVNLGITFRYFFVRKTMLVKYSSGAIIFPGGFGTLDEAFELITLIQTHKVDSTPVVMFGRDYWGGLFEWIEGPVREAGMVSPLDPKLVHITDDIEDAINVVLRRQ